MDGLGYTIVDEDGLQQKIDAIGAIKWAEIIKKNAAQLYNRTQRSTPVSTEKTRPGGPHGELRRSAGVTFKTGAQGVYNAEVGYTAHYAPHVEFGHRTRGGGFVPGQHYLKKMVEAQSPIIKEDIRKAVEDA